MDETLLSLSHINISDLHSNSDKLCFSGLVVDFSGCIYSKNSHEHWNPVACPKWKTQAILNIWQPDQVLLLLVPAKNNSTKTWVYQMPLSEQCLCVINEAIIIHHFKIYLHHNQASSETNLIRDTHSSSDILIIFTLSHDQSIKLISEQNYFELV